MVEKCWQGHKQQQQGEHRAKAGKRACCPIAAPLPGYQSSTSLALSPLPCIPAPHPGCCSRQLVPHRAQGGDWRGCVCQGGPAASQGAVGTRAQSWPLPQHAATALFAVECLPSSWCAPCSRSPPKHSQQPSLPPVCLPTPPPPAALQDEVQLNGAIVLPHKDIKESIMEPGTIIM